MDFSFNECKAILATLPLGYYCGRKVPVVLSDEAETSYYSPLEDTITVSYPIIKHGIKTVTEESMKETAVRSMLYHELSHVILTPDSLMNKWNDEDYKRALNVFEDERIETLLNNYYMDVNFKQQLYNICGSTPTVDTTDSFSVFFNLVRYRYGTPELVSRVASLINNYRNINRGTCVDTVYSYRRDVIDLWELISKQVKSGKIAPSDLMQMAQNLDSTANVDKTNTKPTLSDNGEEANDTKETETVADNMTAQLDAKEVGKIAKECLNATANAKLTAEQQTQLAQAKKTIEMLISNFNKKNSGGNGFNAYSGIFNPRLVNREDYKFFDRIAHANGNNQFGTCHLNLVLDCSGSFYNNTNIVNALLAMLTEIERKTPNFSMDVSFINTRMTTCTKITERRIRCQGGNNIPADFSQRMRKLQKMNSYNYNIVLFDGDALSDYQKGNKDQTRAERFHQIDQSQTCLITDEDNKRYMEGKNKFSKARVIVTRNYTSELIKNVITAFAIMFN